MEAVLALGIIVLANLLALTVGKDSRDGQDWQPLGQLPRPRPPAPSESVQGARPGGWNG